MKLLSEILKIVDTPKGKARVRKYLETQPYAHYEQTDELGYYVRIDAEGRRTVGRFGDRKFQPKSL